MPFSVLQSTGQEPLSTLYEVIIEGAPVMLWLGDADGKCVFLNRRQREFWGVDIGDVDNFDWSSTLHPDDADRLFAPFSVAMSNHTRMETEARFRRATDGAWRVLQTAAEPRLDSTGRFIGMVGVNIDVTDQRAAEADLRRARDAIALATQSSELGWVTWSYETGATELDDRAREILRAGEDDDVSRDWLARLPAEDRVNVEDEIRQSIANGQPYNLVFRLNTPDGETRRIQASGMVEAAPDGTPIGGTGLLRDITDEWREEEFQRLLMGELRHRNRNLLSIVTALVKLSPTEGRSAREFRDGVVSRLLTLASSMELTQGVASGDFDVRKLAESVLEPFGKDAPDRIAIEGEPMQIDAGFARSMGLVLHELATNAAKYGALSRPEGTVKLDWRRGNAPDGARFDFEWRETCDLGAPATGQTGFGMRLLRDLVALETGGTAEWDMTPNGLRYRLSFGL